MKPNPILRFASSRSLAALILTAAVGGSLAIAQNRGERKPSPADNGDLQHAFALSDAFKKVARSVGPSVVNIRSTQNPTVDENQQPESQSPFGEDLFRRFFDQELPEGFDFQGPSPRPRVGEGSGVVVRSDGYILTNNHVVSGADEIRVTLGDDREYDATVVGTDPETDMAIVKIEADGLTGIEWANSDKIEVGDWVLAIGSPFGLDKTVTAGIVSAKGRADMGLTTFEDFIQTDAAINPGNSGGPLVNLYGEVVGINTAISTRTGGSMGVGFAIPSNMVKTVANSIIETGSVERGWLGVQMQPLTEDLARQLGYQGSDAATEAVVIVEVLPDTPAERAGLKSRDIIVTFNGAKIANSRSLLNMVAQAKPGQTAALGVFRDGQPLEVDVKLETRPQQDQLARTGPGQQGGGATRREFGMQVEPLTPEIASRLGLRDTRGVVVTSVAQSSPAAEAGLRPGDVIMEIGETVIRDLDDYNQAMANADAEQGIMMRVRGQGGSRLVVLKTGERSNRR